MTDPSRYPILSGEHRVEQTILRSRFIATVASAPSVDEAHSFVERIKDEFPDATHNCWAYVVGRPGSTDRVGMSDDGEPHGTAGRPMLSVLLHSGLGDIAAVVTRYYGGTKLGTGGLVRAYSGTLQEALEAASRTERVERVDLVAIVEYAHAAAIKAILAPFEAEIVDQTFHTDVTLRLRLPVAQVEAFQAAATNVTRGNILFEPGPRAGDV